MKRDVERWDRKFAARAVAERPAPDVLLQDNPLLPDAGSALDSGSGHNAVYLAQRGLRVTAIDGSSVGMELALALAGRCGVSIRPVVADLDFHAPRGRHDLVIVFHYLNRGLYAHLPTLLKPGGILIVKTFNRDFLDLKPGFNPDYLLRPGELAETFASLEIVEHAESPSESPGKSHAICRAPSRPA